MALAVSLVFVALLLIAAWSAASSGFSPGEEIYVPGVEDVAVGTADAPLPGADAGQLGGGIREARVHLRVEDIPGPVGFVATVERSAPSSLWSRFFGAGDLVAAGGGEGLSASGGGVSGVVEFVVRARDGAALPAGEYTVSVRFAGGRGDGTGAVVARKYFVVGDPQA